MRIRYASDGGGAGSAPSTNHQGTADDVMANQKDYEIKVPFERSCSWCMASNSGNFMALTLNDEIKHVEERHEKVEAVFICAKCGKRYARKHAALCHIPKCTAPKPPPTNGHVCQECGKVFATKTGLSQHQRHEHPVVRNAAQAGGSAVRMHTARRGKIFSEEEEEKMLEMEVRFRGERNVASLMVDFLPGKTGKQIRDKRALASYKKRKEEVLRHVQEEKEEGDEEEADELTNDVPEERSELSVPPGDPPHLNTVETVTLQVVGANHNGADTAAPESADISVLASDNTKEAGWREEIARSALELEFANPMSLEAAACVRLLRGVLAELVNNKGALPTKDQMEEVDDTVVRHFQADNEPRNKKKRGSRRKAAKCKKAFRYARAQELYRENPGLLAKYARNGIDWTKEASPNLNTVDIQNLYKSLWGTMLVIDVPNLELRRRN